MKVTPFHNRVAEEALVGALLIEPHKIDETSVLIKPEHFYDDVLGKIYAALCEMRQASQGIDIASVFIHMEPTGLDRQVTGGLIHLMSQLCETTPDHWHTDYYAKKLHACWRRRMAAMAVETMKTALNDPSEDINEVLGACDAQLRKIEESSQVKADISISSLMVAALQDDSRTSPGLMTGFNKLDEMLCGLRGGQLVVIAARPGIGKSAFAGNIATNLVERGDGVLLVSLEMSQTEFIYRLVARLSGLRLWQIRSPDIKYHEPILHAMNMMNHWPMFIDDSVPLTVSQIGARARGLIRKHKLQMIIVDYLQLLTPSDKKAPREQQVAGMTRDLKLLAKQLNIPIIVLSQLNRGTEQEVKRRPQLRHLRESGAIEQDADVVIFIHRPDNGDSTEETTAEIIIEKQRQGPTGKIDADWDGARFQFREHEESWG